MKKLKLNLSILALIIGLTGAFAFNMPDPDPKFNAIWQEVNSSGVLVIDGEYHDVANIEAAKTAFGCSSNVTPCAARVDQVNGTIQGDYIHKP